MNRKLNQMMGVAAVAMGLLGLAASASADVVVISDTFTLNETTRKVGDPLNGTTTEVGSRTWNKPGVETYSPLFAAGNMVVGATATSAYTAFVPLTGISSTYFSLQMDLNTSGAAWAALAFNSSDASMWYPSLLLTVDKNGGYNLLDNNIAPIPGASGTAPIFTSGAFNNIQLSYYAPSNRVSIAINGVAVVNNLSLGAYTPALNYAGFDFYDGAGKAVDNFQVVIPEPVSASLLLLGLGGLLARRRRSATRN